MGQESLQKEARYKMVETQVVGRGISNDRVLAAMRKVPRHFFVEEAFRARAYGDHALPIGEGQTISQPYMVALMSESLGLCGTEKVLEIGTGSGYQTAVLAELAGRVLSVERISRLISKARAILDQLEYQNIALRAVDGTYGWKDEAPFDAILVAAGSPQIPVPLIAQLKVGGRMIIPVGEKESQILQKVVKKGEDKMVVTSMVSCLFVPLVGAFGWSPAGRASPADSVTLRADDKRLR
ncbi:MAG: protein-L-isoaspartate(D-aspartate) O-methyltransferase [Nitrospirota bacterium]